MPTVLLDDRGDLIFDSGVTRPWTDTLSTAAALADFYVCSGSQGLALHYSAEFPHAPLVIEPGLSTDELMEFLAHWSNSVMAKGVK